MRKPKVPDLFLLAAALERLVALMMRLLSLGLYKGRTTVSDALSAREQLAELADAELGRRRKSPATARERKDALLAYQSAVTERSETLSDRQRLRSMPNPRAAEQAARARAAIRDQGETMFDAQRSADGLDTVKDRRAAAAEAAAELASAEDYVPTATTGFFISKTDRAKALAANQLRARQVARAQLLRDRTAAALRELLDRVESIAAQHAQRRADRKAAEEKAEADERAALAKELGALPEQVLAVAREAQRVHHAERGAAMVADAARPRTAAELAAEAERLRLLMLVNRG